MHRLMVIAAAVNCRWKHCCGEFFASRSMSSEASLEARPAGAALADESGVAAVTVTVAPAPAMALTPMIATSGLQIPPAAVMARTASTVVRERPAASSREALPGHCRDAGNEGHAA
jgi:hypothetical protein